MGVFKMSVYVFAVGCCSVLDAFLVVCMALILFSKFLLSSSLDCKLHKLGRIVINVWTGAFEALADKLEEQFPNDDEHGEFGEADLANPGISIAYLGVRTHFWNEITNSKNVML